MKQGKVWFITGASRGFGRVWTEAALERGDKVVATARPLEDGQYAAQLRIQRALHTKGTYAVEESWDQLGTFSSAQDAVAHARSVAADRLG